jgi:hypothetical protein
VDISVLLPNRWSREGRCISTETSPILSAREAADPGRFNARKPASDGMVVMSRFGSTLRIYRKMSMSFGANPNFHALARYRGAIAIITVIGRQSQK